MFSQSRTGLIKGKSHERKNYTEHQQHSVTTDKTVSCSGEPGLHKGNFSLGNQVMRGQGIETVSKGSLIAAGEGMALGLQKVPVCSEQPWEIRTNGHLRLFSS